MIFGRFPGQFFGHQGKKVSAFQNIRLKLTVHILARQGTRAIASSYGFKMDTSAF